jgi:CBS domain-containing protein
MNVSEVMTADMPLVSPTDPVARVATLMLDSHLSALPVSDATNTLQGMVYAGGLVARHARVHAPLYFGLLGTAVFWPRPHEDEEVRHALAVTASDLMDTDFQTVGPNDSVEDAATILVDDDVPAVPVVENGKVVGMVTERDMLRLLLVEDSDASTAEA